MGIGGGKSSGSSSPVVTEEQKNLLKAQTGFLTDTAFPAYQKTLGKADTAFNQTNPAATTAANTAMNVAGQTGATQQATGTAGTLAGMAGLASLFNPQYEQNQINAALQAGRESARESQVGQNAMYGGSGGLGSSRMALADKNLSSLNAQRQATAAANAQAGVQANKAAAANQLATLGGQQIAGANTAAAARIGYAQTPQDVVSKYASIIYGTPQGTTTPNFAGTQGQQTSGKGGGFKFGGQ
jgi:hypothetical protein